MKEYRIRVFYSAADGGFVANVENLKYCSAFGETVELALREVGIALSLCESENRSLEGAVSGASEVCA